MCQIVTRAVEKIQRVGGITGRLGWAYCAIGRQGAAPASSRTAAECGGTRAGSLVLRSLHQTAFFPPPRRSSGSLKLSVFKTEPLPFKLLPSSVFLISEMASPSVQLLI